jgi:hypothetical protein
MPLIINLTQHTSSADQDDAGVFDSGLDFAPLLNFASLPTAADVEERAIEIARMASNFDCSGGMYGDSNPTPPSHAMIGGAPFLMSALERALLAVGITPLYAFSVRESVESVQPDGSVTKTSVFKHAGFVGSSL